MDKKYFVTTTNKDVADKLTKAHYQLVRICGDTYFFLNNGTLNFEIKAGDVIYTNTYYM